MDGWMEERIHRSNIKYVGSNLQETSERSQPSARTYHNYRHFIISRESEIGLPNKDRSPTTVLTFLQWCRILNSKTKGRLIVCNEGIKS